MSEQPESSSTELSRRDLFRTAGLATGGALLLGLPNLLSGWTGTAEAALSKGALPTTRISLELEGQFAGTLITVDGGGVFADVITENAGLDGIQRKRPGPVRFEDIVFDVALGALEKPLTNWITDALGKTPTPKNGVIVYADLNLNEVKRLEFTGALLSEIMVPEADAKEGKQVAAMTIRLVVQSTRLTDGKGKLPATAATKNKQILSSNFRFNVQGLEKACKRITGVEGISAKRNLIGAPIGQEKIRKSTSVPGALEYSLIHITLPEVEAGPFYQWFDDMVIKGNPNAERAALLEWLDPTMRNVLASVQLGGLGIVRYEPDPIKAGTEEKLGGAVAIDMYFETMTVTL